MPQIINTNIASLNSPSVVSGYAQWSSDQKKAFWLNAYNALVLQTVVDRYPIHGTAKEYPVDSIRQISGAFERTPHAIAGTQVTLDQIETAVLAEFVLVPRAFLPIAEFADDAGTVQAGSTVYPVTMDTDLLRMMAGAQLAVADFIDSLGEETK